MKTNVFAALVVFLFSAVSAFGAAVVINEVDADQKVTDSAEFVELFGSANASLDGLVLVLFNGGVSGDPSYNAFDLDGHSLNANGFFVVCGDGNNVGNCDLDVTPNTNLIQNGTDAVALYEGDGSDFPNGTSPTTSNLVDAVVYDTNDAADTALWAALGVSGQTNERGMGDSTIATVARAPNGTGEFVVLEAITPGAQNVSVPEPASAVFALLGLLGVGLVCRSREIRRR